jgi:hypothetical protein
MTVLPFMAVSGGDDLSQVPPFRSKRRLEEIRCLVVGCMYLGSSFDVVKASIFP